MLETGVERFSFWDGGVAYLPLNTERYFKTLYKLFNGAVGAGHATLGKHLQVKLAKVLCNIDT